MAQDPAQLPPQQLADLSAITTAAKQLGLEIARIDATSPEQNAMALVPKSLVLEHRLVPLKIDGKTLIVAVSDPTLLTKPAPAFLQSLKQQGYTLKIFLTPAVDFAAAVSAYDKAKADQPIATTVPVSTGIPVVTTPAVTPAPTSTLPSIVPVTSPAPITTPIPAPVTPTSVPVVTPSIVTPSATPIPKPAMPQATPVVPITPSTPVVPPAVVPPVAPEATKPQPVPASVISTQIPSVDLVGRTIAREVLERFPEDVAQKYQVVVFELSKDGKEASVAAVKPSDQRIRDILKYVEERNGVRINLFQTTSQGFAQAMRGYQADSDTKTGEQTLSQAMPPVTAAPQASPKQTLPLQRATNDKIRAVAEQPVTSSQAASSTVPVIPAPITPPIPSSPVMPSQSSVQAQPSATSPAKVVVPGNDATPSIAFGQLQTQVGLAVNPETMAGQAAIAQLVSGDEQSNLDQVLGSAITTFEAFEAVLKTGLIPKVVAGIVSYAASQNASDIHIEPSETSMRVRYRIDGKLHSIIKLPVELQAPLVSRIKILSKLKIDEARLPQDGRFDVQVAGHQVDMRISTLPTIHGEKVVIRLLDKTAGVKQLATLGLSGVNLRRVTDAIKKPFGIILVTGPTGSGKSTTLYAMLTEINQPDVNIITLEDPVEYQVEGINQTQVKPAIGYSFADGLRSILRQDPNVIMVGEIRDSETAALATQAALTGHLVLSTLHTNNAAGAIPRLIDMEVEPFLIASSLDIIIAQRLVRRLCKECRVPAQLSTETLADITKELQQSPIPEVRDVASKPLTFFGPGSCDKCTDGYSGRVGIYEVITVSESIAQLAIKQASGAEIETLARKEGMTSLRQDGIIKALEGQTSIDEILTATSE
jgi:type II secretory ATPase GspE/PulE/Tfp pilus assembly ATPase PilB-like protein